MAHASADVDRPLAGIRIIDIVDGPLQTAGRILSDLGAEVIRVEPLGGSPARSRGVVVEGRSLTFEIRNAGKRIVALDLDTESGQAALADLIEDADVLLRDGEARTWERRGLGSDALLAAHDDLVVVDLSDFGAFGAHSAWRGTPDVHAAMSTVLSRSGLPNIEEPLLPPSFLLYESAAVQAVWVVMLELANRRATGRGDIADFSVQEGLLQILDPVFGVGGSARAGVPLRDLPRGRPDARHLYPIFRAKDGWVRICVLAKRQWQGMFEWLGRPEAFADPKYDAIGVRFAAAGTLYPLIGALFATLTMDEAVEQGQQLGVPTASLDSAADVIARDAFRENGSFVESDAGGVVHSGWFEIDGRRVGAQAAVPGAEEGSQPPSPSATPATLGSSQRAPFDGLRVLDLGVIVVGSELGRLFADYGADVIKVESSSFPDGSRQTMGGEVISEGAALGLRNKRSLGLNLRDEEGRAILTELVKVSDVILTNFKPGTLASLGFDFERLQELNPGIILSESSAFGNQGSWSRRLGYGPLVRASAGLSSLWRYPDAADGFSDGITIFPDHVVARLNAAAVAALLFRRDRTGRGGQVSTAQVDAIFGSMADLLRSESLAPGTGPVASGNDRTDDAFQGVYRTLGDDEWMVVDAVGNDPFAKVARSIGRPELVGDPRFASPELRVQNRAELRRILSDWTQSRDGHAVADMLQQEGVPAAPMMRLDDVERDRHLRERRAFGEFHQPQISGSLPTNLAEARFTRIADPRLCPAPLAAEHTRPILREVLDMDDASIDRLLAQGSLEQHPSMSATVAV